MTSWNTSATPVVADGVHREVSDIDADSDVRDWSHGLSAINGGTITATDVRATGNGANSSHGVHAEGSGSRVDFTGGESSTMGFQSNAVNARLGGMVVVSGASLSTSGTQSAGMKSITEGSTVAFSDVDIATSGRGSHAMLVMEQATMAGANARISTTEEVSDGVHVLGGSSFTGTGLQIETTGDQSRGVATGDAGSRLTISDSSIATSGMVAHGARARDGALLEMTNVQVKTTGARSKGVDLQGGNGVIIGSSFESAGHGLDVWQGGSAAITGSDFKTTQADAFGLRVMQSGTLAVQGSSITTLGANAHGVVASANGAAELADTRIETLSNLADGLNIQDGGTVIATNVDILTQGGVAYGIKTVGTGSSAVFTGGSIRTEGESSDGAEAAEGATVQIDGTEIAGTGAYVIGAGANTGGQVEMRNASITLVGGTTQHGLDVRDAGSRVAASNTTVDMSGYNGSGLFASTGGEMNAAGMTVTTSGEMGDAVRVGDGTMTIANSTLSTTGGYSNGVRTVSGGQTTVVGSGISTQGKDAYGVKAEGANSLVSLSGGEITTTGSAARAISAESGAKVTVDGTILGTAALGGRDAHGVYVATGGSAELANASITTTGERSRGLLSDGVDSTITAANTAVQTSGLQSFGAMAIAGSGIELDRVDITTTGDSAHGLFANQGSTLTANNISVATSGAGSMGINANSGATIDVTGGDIRVLGADARGILSTAGATDLNSVRVTDSQILTGSAAAIEVRDAGLSRIEVTNSRIQGGGGLLMTNGAGSVGQSVLQAQRSELVGDIVFSDGYDAGVDLSEATLLKGAAQNVALMDLKDSAWDMTGDSRVGKLSASNSTIAFNHDDGAFKTLTVTGDYVADNAVLQMNTVLGDDASLTDKLHVLGNTSGQSGILVNNVGGQGAETFDGIQLVQVDGDSAGVFNLLGRAVGGSYEYFLHQGGIADPTDGDWYLRSELPVEPPVDPDPCTTNPGGPGCPVIDPPVEPEVPVDPPTDPEIPVDPPVDPPTDPIVIDPPVDPEIVEPPVVPPPAKIYRPETGAYLANQAAAVGMFDMTLHERLGEPNLAERLKSDDTLASAWVRTTSDHTRFNAGEGQLDVASRQSMLQVGTDFAKWGDDSRGLAGIMLATGKSSSQTTSNVTGYGAKGEVDGKALGLYATWMQSADSEKGAYLDAWLQTARFKNEVQGDALATERYDSKALMASIEAGYAMQLHEGADKAFYLEPQAQVTYTDYSMDGDQHVETNGTTVKTVDAGGLQTRLGVRLYGHDTSSEGNRVQPFVAANWIHSEGDNAVAFNGVSLSAGQPSDVYELKAGAQLQMGGGWTGWGELSTLRGKNDYRNYGAQMGVKYSW
ncbi:autotransporter outer membrane beta-barrel domain-containing protein [Stenotrophomonas sp. CFBP 13718]|uniref:autotransporter outer membrane beta-barrel domain-containing protein n=1 Tax=Stenotrophomonas sp. CFBP 13718 TaxID=2775304 RepID=UPI001780C02E|nr:autotransporter outer membrane beta-barrel domain-containing protein [Stenotrophomonas sp. CFBP 13718]MBD8698058.1 autotransporter outer membrane beta-barrel domain-containing protein [Stenotrophomonas sp. CFBP 13718]